MKRAPAGHPQESLDRIALLERFSECPDLLGQLVESYLDAAPTRLDALYRTLGQQDRAGLASAAHLIAGSVGYFQATEAMAIADRLEQMAPLGEWHGILTLVAELERELEQVHRELRTLRAVTSRP